MKKIVIALLCFLNFSMVFTQSERVKKYKNGNVASREIFNSKGEVVMAIGYYQNGNVRDTIPIKNNRINGVLKTYKKNGILSIEQEYKNGIKDGKMIYFFKNSTQIYFFENGKKNQIFHVINYFPNRKIKDEYNNKLFEGYGPYKEYYENGNVKIEGNYDGLKRNGLWKFYNEDGALKKSKEYNKKFVFTFGQFI